MGIVRVILMIFFETWIWPGQSLSLIFSEGGHEIGMRPKYYREVYVYTLAIDIFFSHSQVICKHDIDYVD